MGIENDDSLQRMVGLWPYCTSIVHADLIKDIWFINNKANNLPLFPSNKFNLELYHNQADNSLSIVY